MISLTVTDRTIKNLSAGTAATDADDGNLTGSVGAQYELKMKLAVGGTDDDSNPITDWSNVQVYFNPAVWVDEGYIWPAGLPPTPGFSFVFPETVGAGPFPMSIINMGLQTVPETNGTAVLTVDGSDMVLTYTFRLTADMRRYINNTAPSAMNPSRLLRTSMVSGVPPLVNTATSVYKTGSRPVLRYIVQLSRLDAGRHRRDYVCPFGARWYFLNRAGNGASELGNLATTTLVRDGNTITDFTVSVFSSTIVTVRIPKNVDFNADTVCETAWIRTNNAGNLGGEFMQDYGQDFQAGTVIDDTTHWKIVRTIAPSEVAFEGKYRLILVLRAIDAVTPTDIVSNSFYTFEMRAAETPEPLTVDIDGEIMDYNVEPNVDYVVTTVVDRVRCRVEIDAEAYNADAGTWHGQFADDLNKIRLTAVDTGDSSIVMTRSWFKVGGVWQLGGIGNPSDVEITNPTSDTVRIEFTVPIAFLNTSSLPNWGGTTIMFQWEFETAYPLLQWGVSYDYTQAVQVRDFAGFADVIQKIEFFDYYNGLPLVSLCDTDKVLVKVTLDPVLSAGQDWNIRAFWNVEGYGISDDGSMRPYDGVFEEDGYTSPSGALPQLSDANLIGVPAQFTVGVAMFVFDHADIPDGEKVRIYAIAQPTLVTVPPEDPCEDADMWATPPIEVDFALTSDSQGALEGTPPADDTMFYIFDHPSSTPPGTTLWERYTGGTAKKVPAGTGTEGSMWEMTAYPAATVFHNNAGVGTFDEWLVNVTQNALDTFYTDNGGTGKFGVRALMRPQSIPTGEPMPYALMKVENLLSPYTSTDPAIWSSWSETCRRVTTQYTTAAIPSEDDWVDCSDPVQQTSNTPPSAVPYVGTWTVDGVPPEALYLRNKFTNGANVQGYSDKVAAFV